MQDNTTRAGHYIRQRSGYRAFIPAELPPKEPKINIDAPFLPRWAQKHPLAETTQLVLTGPSHSAQLAKLQAKKRPPKWSFLAAIKNP